MLITHLFANNLFGSRSIAVDVGPVTVFAGPNEAMKSTLLGLPDLVFLGNGSGSASWPVLGTSPNYDWDAGIDLRVDGKRVEIARWVTGGTHEGRVGRGASVKSKTLNDRVAKLVGDAGLFRIENVTELSSAKRQTWLEENVIDAGGWSLDELQKRLEGLGDEWRENMAVALPAWDLKAWVKQQTDGRAGLVSLSNTLDTVYKDAIAEGKRLKTVISASKDRLSTARGGDVAALTAQLEDERRKLQGQQARKGRAVAQAEEHDRVTRAQQDAQRAHSQIVQRDYDKLVERAEAKLSEANGRAHTASVELADAQSSLERARAASERARSDWDRARDSYARARARLDELNAAKEAAQHGAELAKLVGQYLTETSSGPATDTRKKLDALLGDFQATVRGDGIEGARTALGAAEAAKTRCEGAKTQAEAKVRQLGAEVTRLSGLVEVAKKEAGEAATELRKRKTDRDTADERRITSEQQIRKMGARLVELESGMDSTTVIEQAVKAIEATIKELETHIKDAEDENRLEAQLGVDVAAKQHQRQVADAASAAGGGIRTLLSEQLAELTAPLVGPASEITSHVLDGSVLRVSMDNGADFYLERDGQMVPLSQGAKGQSRSPSMVAMLALRLSILRDMEGFKLARVDDLESIELERRNRLLGWAVEAQKAGQIHQFFGTLVDPEGSWEPPPGVTVVRLHSVHRSEP